MRKKSDLTAIGRIVNDSLEGGYLGLAKEMVKVFQVWERAVGPYNAARARPESIKNGRLTVLVKSPVWIDHYSYMKDDFLKKINQALGAPMVQEIVFRVGEMEEEPETAALKDAPGSEAEQRVAPDGSALAAALEAVKDPDLKKELGAWLARQNVRRTE